VTTFIKAEDGSYIAVDHIYEFVPIRGGSAYIAHYPGEDEEGDPASAVFPATVVRSIVAPKRPKARATVD